MATPNRLPAAIALVTAAIAGEDGAMTTVEASGLMPPGPHTAADLAPLVGALVALGQAIAEEGGRRAECQPQEIVQTIAARLGASGDLG